MILPSHEKSQVSCSVEQLEGCRDLGVCKAVEGKVVVLGDGVGVVDAVHPLGHEDGLLLAAHGLHAVAHDVVQPGEHTQALCYLGVHGAVHVVQQVECFRNQLISILQETLLNLGLSSCVEVVGIRGPWVDVLDNGIHVDNVILSETLN